MTSKLDNYKILKLIGKGAFGEVYLAQKNNIQYVIKYINLDILNMADIYLEVAALKKISKYNNCKNIMTTNNSFMCLIDNFPVIEIKKYVIITNYLEDSITLRQLIDINKKNNIIMKLEDMVFLMARLLSQLQQMHNNGLVHSDIKPENIIVQYRNGEIKNVIFIDFGTSCSTQCLPRGTILYLAPELFRIIGYNSIEQLHLLKSTKEQIPINKNDYMKTDIFSLGLVFYEILNNKYPYPYISDYIREKTQEYKTDREKTDREIKKDINNESEEDINNKSEEEEDINNKSEEEEYINNKSEEEEDINNESEEDISISSDESEDTDSFKNYQYIKQNLPTNIIPNNNTQIQIYKLSHFYKDTKHIKSNYIGIYSNELNKIVELMLVINPLHRYSISRIKNEFNKFTIILITSNFFSLGKRHQIESPIQQIM